MNSPSRIKILVLEKNDADFLVFKKNFEGLEEYEITRSGEDTGGISLPGNIFFDLIFISTTSVNPENKELLQKVKQKWHDAPVIILLNNETAAAVPEWIRLGADNCLLKNHFDNADLRLAITAARERMKRVAAYFIKQEAQHQVNRAVETTKLVRMVAHEIKNPLSHIFLSADRLKNIKEGDGEDPQFYYDILEKAGKTIDEVLNSLLSSTSAGEMQMKKKNIVAVTRDSLSNAIERTLAKSIRIVEDYSLDHLESALDEEKLQIALQNIFLNAFEAFENTEQKDPVVQIELRHDDGHAVIVVRDNGSGMSDKTLENLFVPFYSSKSKRKGLGLTFAQQIVLGHNGIIDVKSEAGKGSEFRITIPIVQ